MRSLIPVSWLLFGLLALGCGGSGPRRNAPVKPHRQVSIQVEVYDPVTNYVWEGVGVRILEAEQEWSACRCENPDPVWFYSDVYGTVVFTSQHLARADVGFVEDDYGRALLGPRDDEDEAWVWIEVGAPGFESVFVEVPLRWDEPDVLISVPFP